MIYKCTWKLKLPLKFIISADVKPEFIINEDIKVKLDLFNERYFENINVSTEFELTEAIDFTGISSESISVIDQLTCLVGPEINKFYIVLCQRTNNYYHNIFNGEDFVVPYAVIIHDDNGKPVGGYDSYNIIPGISNNTFESVVNEINLNTNIDIPDLLIRDAQNFIHIGLLDMAILCAHIALEVSVKNKFNKDTFDSDINYRLFSEIKGGQIFMEKHLVLGPHLAFGRSLKEENSELFDDMLLLDKLRNKVAHEGTAMTHTIFNNYTKDEIYSKVEFLIDDVEEVILWVNSLKRDNFT